jgi:hypothetical protein
VLTHLYSMPFLRALLILGRVSNLPTVWSNCLAGWLLGGAGPLDALLVLCVGATCLYTGGMFLNDAFDAEFDRQHRTERPIPSGAISERAVWTWGLGWLAAGAVLLVPQGIVTATFTAMLVLAILVYDALHKRVVFSPVLMSLCRFLLFLLAASTGMNGVSGFAIWVAVVLAAYIVGLSYIARRESTGGGLNYWPLVFLFAPLLLAFIVNDGQFVQPGLLISAIAGLWMLRCLRHTLWSDSVNIGRTVSGLLAGIVLVDLLAVVDAPKELSVVFVLLFVAALLFQRLIPAT